MLINKNKEDVKMSEKVKVVEVADKVACLPGYENFEVGNEKYMLHSRFHHRSSKELRAEQKSKLIIL